MYCENGNRNTSFELIQKQFFSGISLKYFNWNELFTSVNINDLECQKNLLNLTVLHPLVEKYPLKAAYMQSFLKDIISKFEDSGREVSDEVYETYCKLLSSTDVGDMHYRHYFLGSSTDACITLRESSSLVSQGTTGLCSWQASQALANWCLSHNNLLRGKRVLELGSGVGLTGLAVSLCCKPRSYWFSDCHPAVLELLQSNVQLNLAKQQEQNLAHEFKVDQVLLQASLKDTDIGVVKLPWEQVPHSNIGQQIAPDVVLAADVVYDSSIFLPLCAALYHLLSICNGIAIVACTERNPDTLEQFVKLLRTRGLIVCEEELADTTVFMHSLQTPIKIYRVAAVSLLGK